MAKEEKIKSKYLQALSERVLVSGGVMGTNLQAMNLTAEHYGGEKTFGCIDYLVVSYPTAVDQIHRAFLEVGVDAIVTDTFRANRLTLADYGLGEHVTELNTVAAQLARKAADDFSTPSQPRFVAGSIGPSGRLPSLDDPQMTINFPELVELFCEQASALIQGGVDLLLVETSQDILEVKAVIHGIQRAFEETGITLPIQAQVSFDTNGRMLLGTEVSGVLAILEGLPIDVIGMNCSTGPEHMREPLRYLGENSSLPISCIPNAGLPLNVDGKAVFPMEPEPFAAALVEYVEKYNVNVVGGCCGTTPLHLKTLVEKLGVRKPAKRHETPVPSLASAISATPMQQEPRPFLIGERLNSQGSSKFKQLLLAEDFDSMVSLARQQVDSGAHALDLCTALTERPDEGVLMRRLIRVLSQAVSAPLVIDSTDPAVMELALHTAPGRCLLNSVHLEGGRGKAEKLFTLAKTYNAAAIALTIDENGMAKTAVRKLEIARRIHHIAVNEYGLQPGDLVFDPLTFTLATGDAEYLDSAKETLEGIRVIKQELPGVFTSLGVSNVSFGLKQAARAVINSVMLYHAVQAGLDMAIVNPAQVKPYSDIDKTERSLAEDLIFNRVPDALSKLIAHFEEIKLATTGKADLTHPPEGFSAEERLHWSIVHRFKDGIEADIEEILNRQDAVPRSQEAVKILNDVLLPAMKEVGDKFGSGELILPFVLQSAEVMKKAVTVVEQYLEKDSGVSKGKIVLATVYGDVHDIGKNLVNTILSNNGYTVIDLGKQVPAETIIDKAVTEKVDAIGLSALLVSTSQQMPLIVNELARRKLNIPVLIGGAAINRRFGRRILKTEDGDYYAPGVFYCKDAFEGLATMNRLSKVDEREDFLTQIQKEAAEELERAAGGLQREKTIAGKSSLPPANRIPIPPGYGAHIVHQIPLQEVFDLLNRNELYRLSWGAKNAHGEEWVKLQAEFDNRLVTMRREALQSDWYKPQGAYGYWPAQSDGNTLIVYDPASLASSKPVELTRFSFPRQDREDNLSLADYFRPLSSGEMDMVAFQVVTVGRCATERFDKLQAENNYTEAYFHHGLAVQLAEASAEYLHGHVRRELGLAADQGKRYSWGYPAIPELADHARVFQLLPVESELDMSLTSAYQLVPEQSTAAIIIHHPQAKYFNIGESRVDQLTRKASK
ncbi:MAG: methionine synthase [Anaerolineaceae bacterium]|nr:methionine synthase [Anaerolineaceae bacterium]